MPRSARLLLIVFGVFVFLGVSALLARALTATGAERSAVLALLEDQAAGDAAAVLAAVPACAREPACAMTVRERSAALRRPGEVAILNYRPSVGLTLTRRSGVGRVAWKAGPALPVVQCVRVRREGPLTGGGVELLSISDPIDREAACPR